MTKLGIYEMNRLKLVKYLNEDDNNYHTLKANQNSMSFSQFKDFVLAWGGCPARAFEKHVLGTYNEFNKDVFVLGNLGHKIVLEPHTLEQWYDEHKKVLFLYGDKEKGFKKNTEVVITAANKIKDAAVYNQYLIGHKERFFVFYIGGELWRCKMDVCGDGFLTDLKFVRDFQDVYSPYYKERVPWWKNWHYHLQFGVYSEAYVQALDEQRPKAHMIAATKPSKGSNNFDLITFDSDYLHECFLVIEKLLPEVMEIKRGEVEPIRCGHCEYCAQTSLNNLRETVVSLDGVTLSQS